MLELDKARVCGSQALRVTAQPGRLLGPENVPLGLAEQVKRWREGGRGPGKAIPPRQLLLKGRPQGHLPRHSQIPQHRAWRRFCPVMLIE